MAVANNYAPLSGQSNTLTLAGVVRGGDLYGALNFGAPSNPASFGSVHGELFNGGAYDEHMGEANYNPIIQNISCSHHATKKRMVMQGELVAMVGVSPTSSGYGRRRPPIGQTPAAVEALFAGTNPDASNKLEKKAGGKARPLMILPAASDFECRPDGAPQFCAFAVQGVADVILDKDVHDFDGGMVRAYPGDRLYVSFNEASQRIKVSTTKRANSLLLGTVVIAFDTSRGDRNIKVAL